MMFRVIFVGGALGALARELATPLMPALGPMTSSFVVNIVACFVIGWLYAVRHKVHAHVIHLGAIGFCGGLSTFSTFTADLFDHVQAGNVADAVIAASFEIAFGLLAAVLGEMLGRRFHKVAPR